MAKTPTKGKSRVLKHEEVEFSGEPVRVAVAKTALQEEAPGPSRQVRAEPEVVPERAEDGTIERITVRCTCGRETVINCDYLDEGGDQDEPDEQQDA